MHYQTGSSGRVSVPPEKRLPEKKGTSDPALGPYRGFKTNVWDGGTRVPFLAGWRGHISPGVTTDHLVGLVDVLATIAAICGEPLPDGAGADSVNQLPALLQKKGDTVERSEVVATLRRELQKIKGKEPGEEFRCSKNNRQIKIATNMITHSPMLLCVCILAILSQATSPGLLEIVWPGRQHDLGLPY